jgi:hypothetical protein
MEAPLIDNRDLAAIEEEVQELVPFYTPEWPAWDQTDAGVALLKIFAAMLDGEIKRLNQVPEKQFIAFLNMLGTELLPAQPASVPLTFYLSSGTTVPVVVPAGTQAAANKSDGSGQLIYEVAKTFQVTPANLQAVLSCVPSQDQFFNHNPVLTQSPVTLFAGQDLQEHVLYLGHMDVFNLAGEAAIIIQPDPFLRDLADSGLCTWEYWGEATIKASVNEVTVSTITTGWQPLDIEVGGAGDKEISWRHPRQITLKKQKNDTGTFIPGEIKDDHQVNGVQSRWIRCRIQDHVVSQGTTVLTGASMLNCDTGAVGLNGDIWWQPVTDTKRQMAPQSGARIVSLGHVDFNSINAARLASYSYGTAPISGNADYTNQLIADNVFAVLTQNGNYTKIQVSEYGFDLTINWVTYRSLINEVKGDCLSGVLVRSSPLGVSQGINPDTAFYNDIQIDLSKPFYPFGTRPPLNSAFYMASQDAFSKGGARIEIDVTLQSTNQLVNNDVFAVFTNGGNYSKVQVTSNDTDLSIQWVTYAPNNTPGSNFVSMGAATIRAKDTFNCDTGAVGNGGDLWWEQMTSTRRQLVPQGSARIVNLGLVDFDAIVAAGLAGYSYGIDPIPGGTSPQPSADVMLAWEYWNGKGWTTLGGHSFVDNTCKLTSTVLASSGKIYFTCPDDIAQTAVAGQQNYWIRVRLVSGDYGNEYKPATSTFSPYSPPCISALDIKYNVDPVPCQNCWAFNNGVYRSYQDNPDGKLYPFVPLADEHQAVYLGFDTAPSNGPISIFLSLDEQWGAGPHILWQYWSSDGLWENLDVVDNTNGFTLSGTIEFIGPDQGSFVSLELFGSTLYWLRAVDDHDSLGDTHGRPQVLGLYSNTSWALQSQTVQDEVLGSSSGTAGQSFNLTKTPVISAQIWVNEAGSLTDLDMSALAAGGTPVQEIRDAQGKITAFWVCWQEVDDLTLEAGAGDRCYEIDRATGLVFFGDGVHGAIPPVGGSNIKADYRTGGGTIGNVPALAVNTLKSSLAFIDHLSNPLSAGGGCDTELLPQALERGPQVIRHRNYAVTAEDFEDLALQASRSIARVKCLPNYSLQKGTGRDQNGYVTVILLPMSSDAQPVLSMELQQQVQQYLSDRAGNVVTAPQRLQVAGPNYVGVDVTVTLFMAAIDLAPTIEQEALQQLTAFLHPLTGGPDGQGWDFGQLPCLSDFYALLGGIDGVDHLEDLTVNQYDSITGKTVVSSSMLPYGVIFSGKHAIDVKLAASSLVASYS